MNTSTVPRLEQLDFFAGFCLIQKSVPKPKLYRALTPRRQANWCINLAVNSLSESFSGTTKGIRKTLRPRSKRTCVSLTAHGKGSESEKSTTYRRKSAQSSSNCVPNHNRKRSSCRAHFQIMQEALIFRSGNQVSQIASALLTKERPPLSPDWRSLAQ